MISRIRKNVTFRYEKQIVYVMRDWFATMDGIGQWNIRHPSTDKNFTGFDYEQTYKLGFIRCIFDKTIWFLFSFFSELKTQFNKDFPSQWNMFNDTFLDDIASLMARQVCKAIYLFGTPKDSNK